MLQLRTVPAKCVASFMRSEVPLGPTEYLNGGTDANVSSASVSATNKQQKSAAV